MWLLLEATTYTIAPLIYHQRRNLGPCGLEIFCVSGVGLALFLGFTFLALGLHAQEGPGG